MKKLFSLVFIMTLLLIPQFAKAAVTNALPTTEAPTTELPTTETPTTEAPTTEIPTTEQPTSEAPTTEAPATEIKILHTNDMHGRLDAEDGRVIGMAKLKTIKDQEQPTFMFDSGDAFQGLPLSNFSKVRTWLMR